MRKIVVTAITGGRPQAIPNDRARVEAAVARCVMPIGEEEAVAWDRVVAERARAA